LMPLLNKNLKDARKMAIESLEEFPKTFERNWLNEMQKKMGLIKKRKEDVNIINIFLDILKNEKIDFTLGFRKLADLIDREKKDSFFEKKIRNKKVFYDWVSQWKKRIENESDKISVIISTMNNVNPLFIPRNHLVENAINMAVLKDDFLPMRELLEIIKKPFSEKKGKEKFSLPPKPQEVVKNTFCGT